MKVWRWGDYKLTLSQSVKGEVYWELEREDIEDWITICSGDYPPNTDISLLSLFNVLASVNAHWSKFFLDFLSNAKELKE